MIDGKVSPPNIYAADGGVDAAASVAPASEAASSLVAKAAASETAYSVDFGENDQRTMGTAALVAAYQTGEVTGETYVWADHFEDWKPIKEVQELMAAMGTAGPAPAPSPAAPWDSPGVSGDVAPSAGSAPRAAASTRNAADLFGGFATAGSEEDVTTSAPQSEVSETVAATGARNESSVLFSLSALTSAAANQPPTTSAATRTTADREDSGLIDLGALTAAAQASAQQQAAPSPMVPGGALGSPALGSSPLAAPPLGVAPPLGASAQLGLETAPRKSKTPWIVAALSLSLVVGLIAFALILKSGNDEELAAAAAASAALAIPTAPPAPTPTPTPSVQAAPPPTGTAEEADAGAKEKPKKPVVRKWSPRPKTKTTTRTTTTKKTSTGATSGEDVAKKKEPAEQPKPKRNPCGCANGDLQCAMRCAAGQ